MEIIKNAIAGTFESSDAHIEVKPSEDLKINLKSSVQKQFGDQIISTIKEVLKELGVDKAEISIDDKGALDYVLQARLKTALLRASDINANWNDIL